MKRFLLFFLCQLALYGLVAFNIRSIAAGNIPITVITDITIASITFTVIKRIGEAGSKYDIIGYILGGACGSVIALLIAKGV